MRHDKAPFLQTTTTTTKSSLSSLLLLSPTLSLSKSPTQICNKPSSLSSGVISNYIAPALLEFYTYILAADFYIPPPLSSNPPWTHFNLQHPSLLNPAQYLPSRPQSPSALAWLKARWPSSEVSFPLPCRSPWIRTHIAVDLQTLN